MDPQEAVAAAGHGFRHHALDLLRNDTDIGLVATDVAEAIVAEAVGEMTEQDDIVLQRDVGATAATTAATTTTSSSATATETAAATAAATPGEARTTAPAARTHACMAARRCRGSRPAGRHVHGAAAITS